MEHRKYRKERYYKIDPESEPARLQDVREVCKTILEGNAEKFPRIFYLRRKKEFKESKRAFRRTVNIPEKGYNRCEAKKNLAPLAQAYVACEKGVRGSHKFQKEAGAWVFILRQIQKFAHKYPLFKKQPMPFLMAFEELIYSRPRLLSMNYLLRGFFRYNTKTVVLMEDAVTRAPEPITRLVYYALRGDKNKFTAQVRIFNREGKSGCWEIIMSR